jgi:hypothetical protein
MQGAAPSIVAVASANYSLHFKFENNFERHMRAAQEIATQLHCEGLLDKWASNAAGPEKSHTGPPGFKQLGPGEQRGVGKTTLRVLKG